MEQLIATVRGHRRGAGRVNGLCPGPGRGHRGPAELIANYGEHAPRHCRRFAHDVRDAPDTANMPPLTRPGRRRIRGVLR